MKTRHQTRGPSGWSDQSDWVRIWGDPGRWVHDECIARDDEPCPQCRFPWYLHPERFDPEEGIMIHSCNEFPVEPIRAIEACIGP